MTKNPFYNAIFASFYIVVVATFMTSMEHLAPQGKTILVPVAMLSLFVLSAAIMGYIFCYEPINYFLDGKKNEGLKLFLMTVGVFAVITILMFCILFFALR